MFAELIALSLSVFNHQAEPFSQARCEALKAFNAERAGVSLVVLLDGQIVCEDYPNGGAPDAGWRLASGTKSFSGILAAAAVQDGLLDLDERVSDTLVPWRNDPALREITVAQLLSLTSGTDYPGHRRAFRLPSYERAVEVAVSVAEPGAQFSYGSGPFQVFGALMSAKLQAAGQYRDPVTYLHRRILDPIGVAAVEWGERAGDPHLPFGASFTARDWAVFGQFVQQGGVWNGERLVDRDALARVFEGSAANPAYGLTWWLSEPVSDRQRAQIVQLRRASDITRFSDQIPFVVMAAGAGRQRLYVAPQSGLVIVRQTDRARAAMAGRTPAWSDGEFLLLAFSD